YSGKVYCRQIQVFRQVDDRVARDLKCVMKLVGAGSPPRTDFQYPQGSTFTEALGELDDPIGRGGIHQKVGAARDRILLEDERRTERGLRQLCNELAAHHAAENVTHPFVVLALTIEAALRIVADAAQQSLATAHHDSVQIGIVRALMEDLGPERRRPPR